MTQPPPSRVTSAQPGDAADPSPPEDRGSPGWARWVSRLSLVIGLGALGITAWLVGADEIFAQLRAIGALFGVILALEAVITVLDARAIHALAGGPGGPSFGSVVMAQIAGRAVNAVTPGAALGEGTKAAMLTEVTSTPRAVAAVLYVAVLGAVMSFVLVAVGAPVTALLLPLSTTLSVVLVASGFVAAAIAIGLGVLLRRGMLRSLADAAVRIRLVGEARRARWHARLEAVDRRLAGRRTRGRRRRAIVYVAVSRSLTGLSVWLTLAFAGYVASIGELAALMSAGIALAWVARLVPMGLGVNETGNYVLFRALSAPPAYGVTLALARRVLLVLYAAIGFAIIAVWRLARRADLSRKESVHADP